MAETSVVLGFVERPAQALAGLAAARAAGREVTWIAIRPAAGWALKRAGAACRDLDEYHDLAALAELDTRNIARTEEFCRWADERIRRALPEAAQGGLEPALSCYFNLRHVFNAPTLCHALYESVLRRHPGVTELWYWADKPEAPDADLRQKRESMWPRYLRRRARRDGLATREFAPLEEPAAPAPARPKGPGAVAKIFSVVLEVARAMTRPSSRRLAVMDEAYNLAAVLQQNRREGRFAVFNLNRVLRLLEPLARRRGAGARARALALWNELSGDEALRERVNFDGLDTLPLVEDRLKYFFVEIVPATVELHRLASAVLRRLRPGAIAASAMGRYWEKTVSAAARAGGVPFAVYQHGEIGLRVMGPRSHNFWYYNDMYFSDVYLVYGEGQARFCLEKYGEQAKTACVGSASLDAVRRGLEKTDRREAKRELGLPPDRPVISFPLGQFGVGVKIPPTYRSDGATFATQLKIVETFAEFPGVTLVVAPKAVDAAEGNPLFDILAERAYPNVVVSTAGFRALAAASDAFVMDWPSTAFLEALATDRPILITDHLLNWTWQDGVKAHFGGRVRYARDLDAFVALLRRFLSAGDFSAQTDRAFVRDYGTFRDDGRSAERVLDVLENLAASPAPRRVRAPLHA